ncbi:MAG: sigma-54-dependent Fis family transcriptional regulator [Proteobacteria bacterium]|nr:MAG: sigma-54-dependent Fis family transcriptional regulator [Pseudomonadota bacterium]
MENGNVLVLDDERNIVTVLKAILEKRGFTVEGHTEPREALDSLRRNRFDACVTDLYMPDIDGMAFLEETKRLYPGLPVVMITAFGTVDSAVDAIKKGAFDYVTKPFEQSEIVSVLQKAVNTGRLKRLSVDRAEDSFSDAATGESLAFSALLNGKSAAMRTLQETIRKVAPLPSPVLILGESGTGKEYLAEEIHQLSARSFQPLIKVNCAAVSSMNLETELFGGQKPGRVELSHKGTLFLDEISEMPVEVQLKLLDLIESGSFEQPLTGERRRADVRLIAATRNALNREVKEGRSREDLYYKLNVTPLTLPPLRERREDLPELVNFFLGRLNKKLGRSVSGVSPGVMEVFRQVSWPGNLRQLEYVLERMMALSDGNELKESAVLTELRGEIDQNAGAEGASFREVVRRQTQNLEKDLIEKALDEMEGNITRTAEHLGISRKGLQLKMKELGIRQLG